MYLFKLSIFTITRYFYSLSGLTCRFYGFFVCLWRKGQVTYLKREKLSVPAILQVAKDEGIRPTTLERLLKLKPAFKEGGSTTAGQCWGSIKELISNPIVST